MPVRTRRMKNSKKDIVIQDGSSSSNDDNELSLPTKSIVDELRTWMDNRLQEDWKLLMKMSNLNQQRSKQIPQHSFCSKF